MSGAEVGLVLGIITSVISLIEATQRIYDASKDAKGLHEAFRKIAENLPTVLGTLRAAEQVQKDVKAEWQSSDDATKKQAIEASSKEVEQLFETCKQNAKTLRDIFEEVLPGDDDTRIERYRKELRRVRNAFPGRKHEVEGLMQEILGKLQLLHTYHYFKAAVDISKVNAAAEELSKVKSSDPDDGQTSSGQQNVNSGSGRQHIYTMNGGQGNSMHNADTQTFNYTK